jgi:hypothetical protein
MIRSKKKNFYLFFLINKEKGRRIINKNFFIILLKN